MRAATAPVVDAHWYAAEGTAAAVAHAMLVEPARVDVVSALENDDRERAVASAVTCLRWVAACHAMLEGRTGARSALEVDLSIAAGEGDDGVDALRGIAARTAATEEEAQAAARAAQDAVSRLAAALPFSVPVHRTPTGYQPAVDVVSQLERLRHRLGLPLFDWEAWVG